MVATQKLRATAVWMLPARRPPLAFGKCRAGLVEKRAVVASFESAGAREVILWIGNDFSERELMNRSTMKQSINNKEKQDELSKM